MEVSEEKTLAAAFLLVLTFNLVGVDQLWEDLPLGIISVYKKLFLAVVSTQRFQFEQLEHSFGGKIWFMRLVFPPLSSSLICGDRKLKIFLLDCLFYSDTNMVASIGLLFYIKQ